MRRTTAETVTGQAEITFADGEYVFRAGDTETDMYVIRSGQVEVLRPTPDGSVRLATLGKGDFFGEMSLLESLPRDADVRAIGDVEVLSISQGGLLMRIRRDPTFAIEMLHRLSGRIRSLNAALERAIEQP